MLSHLYQYLNPHEFRFYGFRFYVPFHTRFTFKFAQMFVNTLMLADSKNWWECCFKMLYNRSKFETFCQAHLFSDYQQNDGFVKWHKIWSLPFWITLLPMNQSVWPMQGNLLTTILKFIPIKAWTFVFLFLKF